MHDRSDSSSSTSDASDATASLARIGERAFRFPAHAYADQHGPYSDGSVALVLLWPTLAPAAPGEMPTRGAPGYEARIRIGAVTIDSAGAHAALADFVEPDAAEPAQRDDPERNIALRREGAPMYGLTPYSVDTEAAQAFLRGRIGAQAQDAVADHTFSDWYLVRDGERLSTVIVCDEARVPDGLREESGRLLRDADAIAACAHHTLVADGSVRVSIDYPRALLPHWRRIEDAVRAFFDTYRVR